MQIRRFDAFVLIQIILRNVVSGARNVMGIDGWSSFVLTIYCKYLYEIYILDITPPYSIHFVHGACLASVDYFQNKEQTRTDIHG
jgi:hypothetical protein